MFKFLFRNVLDEQLRQYDDKIKSLGRRLSNAENLIDNRERQIQRLIDKVDERIDSLKTGTEKLDSHIDGKLRESFEVLDEYEKLKKSFLPKRY